MSRWRFLVTARLPDHDLAYLHCYTAERALICWQVWEYDRGWPAEIRPRYRTAARELLDAQRQRRDQREPKP